MSKSGLSIQGIISAAKVIVAGATIFAIAFALGVVDNRGEVPEVEADIFDLFGGGPRNKTQAFGKALENKGHDKPQVYQVNGNTVYFSAVQDKASPRRLLEEYQLEFVRLGLNDQAYTSLEGDEDEARLLTGMTGGVVPHIISPSYITMGGVVTRERAATSEDLLKELGAGDHNENTLFRGHRWMEIFREPDSPYTTVIASWSDEEFVYSRMIPELGERDGHDVDMVVPSCPGCLRLNRFVDVGATPSSHVTNIFETTHSPEQVRSFYEWAMGARGWQPASDTDVFDELRNEVEFEGDQMQVVQFHKDDERLEILIHPSGMRHTTVHTALSKK
ncbi:MAG: hypothetical protein ACNA8W_00295 [Bradymonadaceae bacterium]